MTVTVPVKPSLWDTKYVIENLPAWIYSDNKQPESIEECKAKISSTEYTIRDIELQIEIRELELKTGSSRHNSSFEFDRWKTQALRAKQTHLYLLNAHKYWLMLNESKSTETSSKDVRKTVERLIELLIEEPDDFVSQLESLL
jgi:hypothetical protein